MNIILAAGCFVLGFAGMEAIAWLTHKYVMHGILWKLHRDHHQRESDSPVQKNDLFFVFFSIPGILLIYSGVAHGNAVSLWTGLGITAYGFAYFFVHDIFIHRRIAINFPAVNAYFAAIRKAHKVHHKQLGREDAECFGMLWAPLKYFREARRVKQKK